MNHVLALVRSARESALASDGLRSETMLIELLALHEETLAQLQLERLGTVGSTDFLRGMIEQHERVAQGIRLQLEVLRAKDDLERAP